MKRVLFAVSAVLLGSAVHAATLFDAIESVAGEGGLKKVKAQIEVVGADVNAPSDELYTQGFTPLCYAIDNLSKNGSTLNGALRREVVSYLIEKKANPNKISFLSGMTLEGRDGQVTPLIAAVCTRDAALVKILLDAGADPNLSIRHNGFMYSDENGWANHRVSSRSKSSIFGAKYDQNPKLRITAMDAAVWLKDQVMIDLLKAKAPKLAASYNRDTLWYKTYSNDLAGFKALIKAGQVPEQDDVEYLIHFGKKDFLAFLDAAAVFEITNDNPFDKKQFSLVDDSPAISDVCAYLDTNIDLLSKDPEAFAVGLNALSIQRQVFVDWSFAEKTVTKFCDRPEIPALFYIAFHRSQLDGYYGRTDDEMWLSISGSASVYELKYRDPSAGEPKSGKIALLEARREHILCDFEGFGKYWVSVPVSAGKDIELRVSMDSSYGRNNFTLYPWNKEVWDAMKRP